ncbi:MAG: hypothetical protein M3Y05_13055 [Gemmatimonadota bacterium]|nr:hypothetical protein [Gemmatimonadota bacterium]
MITLDIRRWTVAHLVGPSVSYWLGFPVRGGLTERVATMRSSMPAERRQQRS